MEINNKYNYGDIVFLETDIELLPRIITAIIIKENNSIYYELSCAENKSIHSEIEITIEVEDDSSIQINLN